MRLHDAVRAAGEADLPAVAEICSAAGAEHPLSRHLGLPTPEVAQARLEGFLRQPGATVGIAISGGEIVAVSLAQVQPPGLFWERSWLQLEMLYVRPGARRRGLGRALLTHVVQFCLASGVERIVTLPVSGARSEQRFLSRLGFAAEGSRRVADPAVLMRRLGHDPARRGLESLIARRRADRAISTTTAEPTDPADPTVAGSEPVPQSEPDESTRHVRRAEAIRRSSESVTSTR